MLVCVPLVTLNLASLLLGRKWASAALGRKTAFGRSPRVHWEGRGQRISVSPRHGTGCEEIVGNVNNGTKRRRAAAGSPCSRTIWISMLEKIKSNYASLFFKLKQWHLWRQWRLFNLYTIRIQRNGEDYWVFLSLILMFNKHKQPKRTNQCSCSLHVSITPTVTPHFYKQPHVSSAMGCISAFTRLKHIQNQRHEFWIHICIFLMWVLFPHVYTKVYSWFIFQEKKVNKIVSV